MPATENTNLAERTRLRNDKLWVTLDWGGLLTPIADEQTALNVLGAAAIENYMAISDDAWGIKEYQRNKEDEFDHAEIAQGYRLTDDKAAVERQKLAIKTATDNYVLAVRVYDAKVRALLMGAKEFAALVEREQLEIEVRRAALAVEKERLRQYKISAEIYEEQLKRAMVEADIARAQVDVAKAHVRAIMADIAAQEADIRLITVQIEQYMAQADKAGLKADVAMLFADILTKQLSAVKLDMGQAEIAAGFEFIQQKLDDALALLAIQKRGEQVKAGHAEAILTEIRMLLPEEMRSEDLRETEQLNAREVFNYAKAATYQNIVAEIALRALAVDARMSLMTVKKNMREDEDWKRTWADALVNKAQRWVHKHYQRGSTEYYTQYEFITG